MRRHIISIQDVERHVSGDTRANSDGHHGGSSFRLINKKTVGSEDLRVAIQEYPAGGFTTGHPIHTDREQCYYILHGTMNINIDGAEYAAPKGSFVYIPRGCEHNHRNDGPEVLQFIIINCPVKSGEIPPIPEYQGA